MPSLRNPFRRLTLPPRPGGADGEVVDQAAEMLASPTGPLHLEPQEAVVVSRYMQPARIAAGTTFIREGDARADFLLLVLEGDVVVESIVVSRTTPIVVRVLGPGSMHGDAGLLDGQARSASCTAGSDLVGAVLTRDALHRLLEEHPAACAKLVIAVGTNLAARLRETTITLKRYVQLTRTLQEEIDKALPT